MNEKPTGKKAYGSIPHLPGSRTGERDYTIHQGQADILTKSIRDCYDTVIVTEKLDGCNVAVVRKNDELIALNRAGYRAETSPWEQHRQFARWVRFNESYFNNLENDEQLSGEWLGMAHGTLYDKQAVSLHPFVVFDIFHGPYSGKFRSPSLWVMSHITTKFPNLKTPYLLSYGPACSVQQVETRMGKYTAHGLENTQVLAEGFVYRLERNGWVEMVAKHVRRKKIDGKYLSSQTGEDPVWLLEAFRDKDYE